MNTLSWMIYLADVVGALGVLATAIAIVATGICGFAASMVAVDAYGAETSPWGWLRRGAWIAIPAGLVAVITPSQATVYAIAASEMGEEVVKSDTAGKAMKALDAWLDKQIALEDSE